MGANVAGEFFRIADRALGNSRHMALNALLGVELNVKILRFFEVTIFTFGADSLRRIGLAKLDDAYVWIMTDDTVDSHVLGLEEFLILFMMANETITGIKGLHHSSKMALTTSGRTPIHLHFEGHGVLSMLASRTVAFFTLNATLRPCTNKTW
jgi:hypothetical protein